MIGSIRFAGDFSPWLVFGIVAVAVLAVCWLYAKEAKSLASPYNVLLPALRSSAVAFLSLIHISEPTRPERISYAVFCLKKKK